jgi:hypothetical protein
MQSNDTAISGSLPGLQLDRKNVENIQHFQAQQDHRSAGHSDGQNLAEIQAAAAGIETPKYEAEDVQGSEAEHEYPKNVVHAVLLGGVQIREVGQLNECQNGLQTESTSGPAGSEDTIGQVRRHGLGDRLAFQLVQIPPRN